MAGVQLAMTQPIRLYDAVIVENEYGTIEEITSTYVVVKLWDLRRMIVPLTYFIEKLFQNWTRTTADILGTVFLQVDYDVPVDAVSTSASGVDPHISEANARIQAHRVAAVRHIPLQRVMDLISDNTDGRFVGLFGEPGVNVVKLNLAVEEEATS